MSIREQRGLLRKLEKRCVEKKVPFYALFELTYHCNLSCRHCYVVQDGTEELSLEEIKAILSQLVEAGTLYLVFTGGEVFTRGDLFPILKYAKKLGFFLILMTNGSLIKAKEAEELGKLKPKGIEVSLYGAIPDTHDFITGVPGSFQATIEAIRQLVSQGLYVVTKTVAMSLNIEELTEIRSLARRLGAVPRIGPGIIPKRDGSCFPKQYDLSLEERLAYLPDEEQGEGYFPAQEKSPLGGLICKAGKAVCAINPYGEVSPCILMPLKLGNLREASFSSIWWPRDNQVLNELRAIRAEDLTFCSKCDFRSSCVRCPGEAYLETRDLFGYASSACQSAKWRAIKKYGIERKGVLKWKKRSMRNPRSNLKR